MAKTPTTITEEIQILSLSQGTVSFAVVGSMPLIFNRMAEKAKRELLLPRGRKTAADRAQQLKHDPITEYRNSVYRNFDDTAPTRLRLPAPAFKGAMGTAALDLPGTRKSEIGRLVWVAGTYIDIWGVPKLLMSVVRSADMARTPDIRTRAILPKWAGVVTVNFVRPKLTAIGIANLLAAGGIVAGVGDFRQEKGKGSYGQWQCVDANDSEFKEIVATGGREAQDAALEDPQCYDEETEELLSWYTAEVIKITDRPTKKAA